MSRLHIEIDNVRNDVIPLGGYCNNIADIEGKIYNVMYNIDSKISCRKNISTRLQIALQESNKIQERIDRLNRFINESADRYDQAEINVEKIGTELFELPNLLMWYDNFLNSDNSKWFNYKPLITPGSIYFDSVAGYGIFKQLENLKKDGYMLKRVGDYIIVKGARSSSAISEGVNGTRYSLKKLAENFEKDPDKYGTVAKTFNEKIAVSEAFNLKELGGKLNVIGLAIDGGMDIYDGVIKKTSKSQVAANVTTDIAFDCGNIAACAAAGAAIGTVFPGAGNVVGAVVGLAVGIGYTAITNCAKLDSFGGTDADGHYSESRSLQQATKEELGKVYKKVGDAAEEGIATAIPEIKNKYENIESSIGNAISAVF